MKVLDPKKKTVTGPSGGIIGDPPPPFENFTGTNEDGASSDLGVSTGGTSEYIPQNVLNPQERHVCVVLLVDTSLSMGLNGGLEQLNAGLTEFEAALEQEKLVRGKMDIALLTFNDTVEEKIPMCPGNSFRITEQLDCSGETSFNHGMLRALDLIEEKHKVYSKLDISYYAPWLFVITDGQPTDQEKETEVLSRLSALYQKNRLVFLPVGVGSADYTTLKIYTKDRKGPLIKAKSTNFKEVFQTLLVSISASTCGDDSIPVLKVANDNTVKKDTDQGIVIDFR